MEHKTGRRIHEGDFIWALGSTRAVYFTVALFFVIHLYAQVFFRSMKLFLIKECAKFFKGHCILFFIL